jgi:hypothetical protein
MLYRILADALVLVHFAFVVFVVLGGLLALRWPKAVWVHLPAAGWGAYIELSGGICPLTPLEVSLRQAGGEAGYSGGFVEQYVIPLLYPAELTTDIQVVLGIVVVLVNVAVYGFVVWRFRAGGGS